MLTCFWKRILPVFLLGLILASQSLMTVTALSDAQQRLFLENINYFDINPQCNASAASPSAGGVTPGPVYIMGDSITALAKSTYENKFSGGGWSATVNGLSSRQIQGGVSPDGLSALSNDQSTIGQAHAIIIALGTNGITNSAASTKSLVHQAMTKIKGYDTQNAPIFWVNVLDTGYDAASKTTNQAIKDGVGSDGTVIDWYSEAKSKADLSSFNGGVHPTKQADIDLLVNLVYNSVTSSSSTSSPPGGTGNGVTFDDSQSSDTGGQTTIDDDGIDPSPTGSGDHQSGTTYPGLGALHTNFIALNPGWASAHGIVIGDVAMLTYHGKTVYAVYGDNHAGNTVHAEISVKAAMGLTGVNDAAKADVTSLSGVHTVVYINTHSQLNGSVDQSKIDQIGAQASGGGNPSSGSGTGSCCDTSATGGDVSTLTGSDNQHKAFNFFVQEGLSPAQAAGVLANLINESGVDPTNGGSPTNGVGFGIAQWTFTARQAPLIAFAASQGKPVTDLLVQLQFMWHELSADYKSTLDSVKQIAGNDASAAGQAAVVFRDGYEACNMAHTSCSDRQSVGEQTFQTYGNSSSGSTGGSTGGSCSSSTAPGGFTNPFSGGWEPNRLDMGYDGTFKGQIVAPFAGTITFAANSFSNWGGYIEIKADSPISGLPTTTLYFAEGITPIVQSGHVDAGQPIADPTPSPWNGISGNIEWGVAKDGPPWPSNTYVYGQCGSQGAKDSVLAFSQWAQQTLKVAPPSETSNAGCP